MLLLVVLTFSQCVGMNTADKKQPERSTKDKINNSMAKGSAPKGLTSLPHSHKPHPTPKHHSLSSHYHGNNDKKRHRPSVDDDIVWTEHTSSTGRPYYYNRKTDESQWEKPPGYIKKSKPDSHVKSDSTRPHPRSSDGHVDRKHGRHLSSTPNRYHRDHQHGNAATSSDHKSGSGTHRLVHDKKTTGSAGGVGEAAKAPRASPKLPSTYVTSQQQQQAPFTSPLQQDRSAGGTPGNCSSPLVSQQHPLLLKPMTPLLPYPQQPSFPMSTPSPRQLHLQPSSTPGQHSNGPSSAAVESKPGPYGPWQPVNHPVVPMGDLDKYPGTMQSQVARFFDHPPPLPPMDNLSQGLHPLQQALLLHNQQNQVTTPVHTPLNTPCKMDQFSLPPLSANRSYPHHGIHALQHSHSNPSTPHLQKVTGPSPYQLFQEQQQQQKMVLEETRLSLERSHSLPTGSREFGRELFPAGHVVPGVKPLDGFNRQQQQVVEPSVKGGGQSDQEKQMEQQKIQIGLEYFSKPLTEFWITTAHDSLKKQLCQASADTLTHKHLEGMRQVVQVKKRSIHCSVVHLRSIIKHKQVENIRKTINQFLNKR